MKGNHCGGNENQSAIFIDCNMLVTPLLRIMAVAPQTTPLNPFKRSSIQSGIIFN